MLIPTRHDPNALPDDVRRNIMLNNPVIYNKIMGLADELAKKLEPQTKFLIDMYIGIRFKDIETGQTFAYIGAASPLAHGDLVTLVTEAARKPLEKLEHMSYLLISECPPVIMVPGEEAEPIIPELVKPSVTGTKIISGIDFIKYFAIGKWVLVDPIKKRSLEGYT